MKDQVKYLRCISGGVTGISVGDVRKAWRDQEGCWVLEDIVSPDSPWKLEDDLSNIRNLDCYFEEVASSTQERDTTDTNKSEPEFGDILHVKGRPHVFIRIDVDDDWVVRDAGDSVDYLQREDFDEYTPNPHQEQRERILKRWQRKSLDNAMDTEVCIAEMRVSDLIDFVQENILAET